MFAQQAASCWFCHKGGPHRLGLPSSCIPLFPYYPFGAVPWGRTPPFLRQPFGVKGRKAEPIAWSHSHHGVVLSTALSIPSPAAAPCSLCPHTLCAVTSPPKTPGDQQGALGMPQRQAFHLSLALQGPGMRSFGRAMLPPRWEGAVHGLPRHLLSGPCSCNHLVPASSHMAPRSLAELTLQRVSKGHALNFREISHERICFWQFVKCIFDLCWTNWEV